MDIQLFDFNGAEELFNNKFKAEADEVERSLKSAALHFKESDQQGKEGSLIFDPVGTNLAIKGELEQHAWMPNTAVPKKFDFLGTDVDFVKNGVLAEVQFSNYPFFLNNVVRGELLFQSKENIGDHPIEAMMMITKAHMFPASNSTLYFEQAVNQASELSKYSVLEIPIRVIGLFSKTGDTAAMYTEYHEKRYSRTVVTQTERNITISPGRGANSRCTVTFT